MRKVIIQGFEGSFHDEIAHQYYADTELDIVCADSFGTLVQQFVSDHTIDNAIMAIENSIAGTILQNYRLIREQRLHIVGEAYLRIRLNLITLPGVDMPDLTEIHSHPMALYQCTKFLNRYPNIRLVEAEDTALSVQKLAAEGTRSVGALASTRAATLYDLPVLHAGIENNKANYTRFFVVSRDEQHNTAADKASIWCTTSHSRGSLAALLNIIADHEVNLSKLQSFPVLGRLSEYSFHLDLEFDEVATYFHLKDVLTKHCGDYHELGLYKRADISAALSGIGDSDVML